MPISTFALAIMLTLTVGAIQLMLGIDYHVKGE
jgi:hypothetical protein